VRGATERTSAIATAAQFKFAAAHARCRYHTQLMSAHEVTGNNDLSASPLRLFADSRDSWTPRGADFLGRSAVREEAHTNGRSIPGRADVSAAVSSEQDLLAD
jgi:hypothetical protein